MAAPQRFNQNARPVGDLYAPFFRTSFYVGDIQKTEQADQLKLTAFTQGDFESKFVIAGGARGAEARIGEHILKVGASLTAESKAGSPYRFTLTLTPEYHDALKILDSGLLGYATLARVEWGYLSADGQAEIKTQPHIFRNIHPKAKFGENISIIVSGYDMLSDIAMRRSAAQPYTANGSRTPLNIIQEVLGRIGERAEIRTDTAITAAHPLNRPITEDILQRHTDWGFVSHLLRRLSLTFRIMAEGETTVFQIYNPVKPPRTSKTSYTFKWRQQLTSKFDVPVYSIDANYLPNMYQPPAGRGLLSLSVNNETGETTVVRADGADTDTVQPGADSGPPLRSNASGWSAIPDTTRSSPTGESAVSVPGAASDAEAGLVISHPSSSAIADQTRDQIGAAESAIIKEAQFRSHPIVKLSCPGVVDMFPGLITDLQGASDIFNGCYTVLEAKHSITANGYDTNVTLIRFVQRMEQTEEPSINPCSPPDGSGAQKPTVNPGEPGRESTSSPPGA